MRWVLAGLAGCGAVKAPGLMWGGSLGVGVAEGAEWASPTLGGMRWIPPGTFVMGSPEGQAWSERDEVQHRVTLTRGFWLMEAEVTQAQWRAVMGSSPVEAMQYEGSMGYVPCAVYSGVSLVGEALPVHCVSYEEVTIFIERVSARDKVQYRLPTEAEWEYAARAGTEAIYAGTSDDASVCRYANVATLEAKKRLGWLQSFEVFECEDGYVTLAPIKSLLPNAWGLYDMTGNVREWVEDWYTGYPTHDVVDYVNRTPTALRANRGDGWIGAPMTASVSQRNENQPDERFPDLGFRLARSP